MLDAQISSETILPQDGFSVDFEHIVYIFWKYITCAMDWYIVWLYLRTLIFHPCGSPQRELFCSRGANAQLCFDCLAYFFYCLGMRNIWAKFLAFITICTIAVVMGWNKTKWNDLMKLRWEITEALFLHVRGKLFEEPQNGKNVTKRV